MVRFQGLSLSQLLLLWGPFSTVLRGQPTAVANYHRRSDLLPVVFLVPQGPLGSILVRGDHPNSRKNAPRMKGWVRGNSGNRSESCSENCGFRIDQVVRGHSENGISYSENGISNSESCSENIPELSQSSENGLSALRAFFLKLGWFPGF